jgi:hypothetical protein
MSVGICIHAYYMKRMKREDMKTVKVGRATRVEMPADAGHKGLPVDFYCWS